MSTTLNRNTLSHEKNEKAVALMLKYMRGELEGELKLKVSQAVKNCKSCRNLYEELQEFFDPYQNLIYEVNNEEEVNRTDALFDSIFTLYDPPSTSAIPSQDHRFELADFEATDCLGCSA